MDYIYLRELCASNRSLRLSVIAESGTFEDVPEFARRNREACFAVSALRLAGFNVNRYISIIDETAGRVCITYEWNTRGIDARHAAIELAEILETTPDGVDRFLNAFSEHNPAFAKRCILHRLNVIDSMTFYQYFKMTRGDERVYAEGFDDINARTIDAVSMIDICGGLKARFEIDGFKDGEGVICRTVGYPLAGIDRGDLYGRMCDYIRSQERCKLSRHFEAIKNAVDFAYNRATAAFYEAIDIDDIDD